MAERTEQQNVSIDPKLEATDERGLNQLSKAFDDSFGPRESQSAPPTAKEAPRPRQEPRTEPEKAKPGHHRPVEVKSVLQPDGERAKSLNLLGEPDYVARKRERKVIEFEDSDIPTDKKSSSFPGRDGKSGKFVKGGQAPAVSPEVEKEEEGEEEPEKEEADPEVDAVVAKPTAHPEVKRGISTLKNIAKARRTEIRTLLEQSKRLQTELESIKRTGMSPEVQQELERLRATSQRFDLLNDPGFQTRYENPVEQAGDRLLQFCIDLSQGNETVRQWANETKKFGYKNLSHDYWDKEIIPKIESITNQQRVAALAADLHAKVDERNRVVSEFTSGPDKIQAYRTQQAYDYYLNYANEAQDESNKLVAQVGEWAQLKDLEKAGTDEERAIFKEHNDRVDGYKTLFEKTMGDVMHGGPRKHVRVVAQAVYGIELDRQMKELKADYEALSNDYEALRSQYNKVTRARAVPGRTGGGAERGVATQPGALSTKSAREAFKDYFGTGGS